MSESTQQRLDRVRTAIKRIEEGAQNVTYEGKSVRRADLDILYRRERALEVRLKRERRGGVRVRGATPV